MDTKNWILFKLATYLCLTLALVQFVGYLYILNQDTGSSTNHTYTLFAYSLPLLQCMLHILNIRLLYHHLPQGLVPSKSFNVLSYISTRIVFLCIVICAASAVIMLLSVPHSSEIHNMDATEKIFISILILIAISNSYCLFAGWQLRKILRLNNRNIEIELLDKFGK